MSPLFAQVTLSISSANPNVGDTFSIDVTVTGFDSLSSALFRLKWDPSVIRLDEAEMPVDSVTSMSPFSNNPEPNRITFLYYNSNGVGDDGNLASDSRLLRLHFTAVGVGADSTCLEIDPSGVLEFVKLASEELAVTVIEGCVHLQGVNSIPSQEHQKLNCFWQSNDRLIVNHTASTAYAFVEVFTIDGQKLTKANVAPQTTTTPIFVSPDWQRTLLVVKYTQNGQSYSRLIPGPR